VKIPIEKIDVDGSTQIRKSLDTDALASYKETYESGGKIPPIVLYGTADAWWIGDGFHRVEAAGQAGLTEIEAKTKKGGKREARWYAMGANHEPGVRYTTKDKQRAVELALLDAKWVKLSNVAIANHCHVHDKTVGKIRKKLEASSEIPRIEKRTCTRGGKEIQMNVSKINANRPKPPPKPKPPEPEKEPTDKAKPALNSGKRVRNCIGLHTADQAIRVLAAIQKTDTKRKEGLKAVCEWLQAQNACECKGGTSNG
jgi:ParB-like chromosome segregation protein Spo0J